MASSVSGSGPGGADGSAQYPIVLSPANDLNGHVAAQSDSDAAMPVPVHWSQASNCPPA